VPAFLLFNFGIYACLPLEKLGVYDAGQGGTCDATGLPACFVVTESRKSCCCCWGVTTSHY
jgi:hypothetical protein